MSGGGGSTQTVQQKLDPAIVPYVTYGLDEAQNLYDSNTTPAFYPGQTFVGPSQQTQSALGAAQNRAIMGNPLTPAAQNQFLSTIEGDYLSSGNPYMQSVFDTSANMAQTKFNDAMNQINSNASMAGRYGSNAMGQLQDRATSQFAQSLANTAGQLGYQNYDTERARQLQTAQQAPAMAATDYQDINQMLNLGQVAEGYQEAALGDSMQRFNFAQNQPYAKLQNYLSAAYGSPQGMETSKPIYRNPVAGALGGALTAGSLFGSGGEINPYAAAAGGALGLLG